MSPVDRSEFMQALAPLFAAYAKPLTEDQADAYWRYLADLPLQAVLDGIEAAGRKAGRYVPTVGTIRECIDGETSRVRDTRKTYQAGGEPKCWTCDDTGWAPTTIAHPRGYTVPAVRACDCEAGDNKRRGAKAVAA